MQGSVLPSVGVAMSSVRNEFVQLLANYGHIGFTFVGCIFIGFGGGLLLDTKVFSGRTSPIFTFVGLAFGIAAGFKSLYDVYRRAQNMDADESESGRDS